MKMRLLGHVLAAGVIGLTAVTAYHYFQTATASVASTGDGLDASPGFSQLFPHDFPVLGAGYSLAQLKNLERTNYYVREHYVDPRRIDHFAMFEAALLRVERTVPEVVLRLEGQPAEDGAGRRLHVAVGNYSDVLTLGRIDSFDSLEMELRRVAAILDDRLPEGEIEPQEVEFALINGMLSTLDPHSVFLPPESAGKMEEENEGEFGGLGITIESKEGRLTVSFPLEDTPAHRAGLKAGDRIVRIEGEGTLNMDLDEAVRKMRGPPGTKITITVDRDGFEVPRDFTIVREMIKPSRVWSRLLEGNVGYVRIDNFHAQVDVQLDEELARLQRDAGPRGLRGIVLDMRDNPGGYLHQAIAVADRFLDRGTIVATVERNGRNRESKEARAEPTDVKLPVAVLMSGHSASAAEIVAGALRNNERAVIIGERSFGKGSVQNLYPFTAGPDADSKLKLTVARYLTPGDHSIQSVGIPADIELKPAVVYPPKEIKPDPKDGPEARPEMSGPRISLFFRDHLQREVDLDGHLASDGESGGLSAYTVRYLAPDPDAEDLGAGRTDRKDVSRDFDVLLARDVLLAADGARRAEVLRDAAGVVAARNKQEGARIEAAFRGQAVDWSPCANPASADLDLQLTVGDDGSLHAGTLEPLSLTVTNRSGVPVCQVVARATSGNEVLDGLEYYLGRIEPGQSRTYAPKVRLSPAYPTELSQLAVTVADLSGQVLAERELVARATGPALPRYAWSWTFDDAAGGDGDGTLDVGETVTLKVDVLNVGEGRGGRVEFTLKKGEGLGQAVELVSDRATFGVDGLDPGGRASGELSFKVAASPAGDVVPMVLRVADARLYDYAAIVKAGFFDYYTQEEDIRAQVGAVLPAARREPPAVQITRGPGLEATDPVVTLSGVATDDVGVRDVIVYHGDRKIAYAGGGDGTPLKSVPFSASAELQEGNNLLVVLVRDVNGLTTTRSVDVYRPPAGSTARISQVPGGSTPAP